MPVGTPRASTLAKLNTNIDILPWAGRVSGSFGLIRPLEPIDSLEMGNLGDAGRAPLIGWLPLPGRDERMRETPETVYVVDDDPGIRRALERILNAAGFHSQTFASATAYLTGEEPDVPGCVVLDVTLPDLDGLNLQRRMTDSGRDRPIVFISAWGTIPLSVRAMRAGAVTFLTKPVAERDLLPAVREAVAMDRHWRRDREERSAARARLRLLTPREREVMEHIVNGLLNKQIAGALGTVEQTVKVHRARVMKKMAARSVAELVRLATLAWSVPTHHQPGSSP